MTLSAAAVLVLDCRQNHAFLSLPVSRAEREMSHFIFHFPEWRSSDSTERFTRVGVHALEPCFGCCANKSIHPLVQQERKGKQKKKGAYILRDLSVRC